MHITDLSLLDPGYVKTFTNSKIAVANRVAVAYAVLGFGWVCINADYCYSIGFWECG